MKNYKTGICINCGADSGLHHFETQQCPKNGREETRFDKLSGKCIPQQWESTTFEDSGIKKLHDAAPEMLEACKEALKMYNDIEPAGGWQHVHDLLVTALGKASGLSKAGIHGHIIEKDALKSITGLQEQTNLKKLPEWCFAMHPKKHIIIRIDRGESGFSLTIAEDMPYISTKDYKNVYEFIDHLNENIGVTPGQRQAMIFGSMFGWHLPMADPDVYDERGIIIREKL